MSLQENEDYGQKDQYSPGKERQIENDDFNGTSGSSDEAQNEHHIYNQQGDQNNNPFDADDEEEADDEEDYDSDDLDDKDDIIEEEDELESDNN